MTRRKGDTGKPFALTQEILLYLLVLCQGIEGALTEVIEMFSRHERTGDIADGNVLSAVAVRRDSR